MTMRVELKNIREAPIDVAVDASPVALDLEDPEFRFEENVTGTINFRLVGDRVIAKGPLQTHTIGQCVRCLSDVRLALKGNLDAVYENDPELLKPERKAFGSDEQIITYFDGEAINPEPEIRETLMLELPLRTLCKEDCKGLCATCGKNLNEGTCACGDKQQDGNAWKLALKNIKLPDN
jgi:uncharacterized protein